MTKKEQAISFLELAATGKVREAYDKFVHPQFIHHNAYFKGDRESLLLAMDEASVNTPNKSIEVMRVLEDGDMVATHSRVKRADSNAPDIAVVHIFRFEDDKIIEEWEAGMEVPEDCPNENGVF
jgi:predicted SnoaL-like aldol condensation-catalyzing enzyme